MGNQHPSTRAVRLLQFARLTDNSDLSLMLIDIAAALQSQELASRHFSGKQMSTAIAIMVDGYVRMNDREALEELERSREQLAAHLRHRSCRLDTSATIRQIEKEISLIQAGLARLVSAT